MADDRVRISLSDDERTKLEEDLKTAQHWSLQGCRDALMVGAAVLAEAQKGLKANDFPVRGPMIRGLIEFLGKTGDGLGVFERFRRIGNNIQTELQRHDAATAAETKDKNPAAARRARAKARAPGK